MGHQAEAEEQQPTTEADLEPWCQSSGEQGQGRCQAGEHEQRVAEPPMTRDIGHRIAVIDDHIQIRQGSQHGTEQHGPASQASAQHDAADGRPEGGLGHRIHDALMPRDSRAVRRRGYDAVSGNRRDGRRADIPCSSGTRRRSRDR